MKARVLSAALSLVFLLLAVFSGAIVSERVQIDTFRNVEAVGSGFQRLRHFIASALYLQLDDYHHIEMYQGIPWSEVTDYLPQMWLIAKLDPSLTDVYTDAAFHLAVNLDQVEEGMDFIREGLRNNPDSLDVRFQYTYLLWATETGDPEGILQECLAYRDLLRRNSGHSDEPYCEPSSATMIAEVIKAETDSLNPYVLFYESRAVFIRNSIRAGLYYPGYLAEPPDYIKPLKMEMPQQ